MRNLVKTYSFIPGSRNITVTGLQSFTKNDIYLIINQTQKTIIASALQMDNIISVTGNVISYSTSLPPLVSGDEIKIEIDSNFLIGVESDVQAGKNYIAQQITNKGVGATGSDTLMDLGDKVLAISQNPIEIQNGEYHPNDYNLVSELNMHIPVAYPHCYIVKFAKDQMTTSLNGADAYYTSDGQSYTNSSVHTWNDWNNDKISRYVIYAFANRNCNVLFSTLGVTNIQELMFDDVTVGTVTMTGAIVGRVWGSSKTIISNTVSTNAFWNCTSLTAVDIPITDISTWTNAFAACTSLQSLNLRNMIIGCNGLANGCTSLYYVDARNAKRLGSGTNVNAGVAFQNCSKLKSIRLDSLEDLYGGDLRGAGVVEVILPSIKNTYLASMGDGNNRALKRIYIGKSLISWNNQCVYGDGALGVIDIEFEPEFNTAIDLRLLANLTTANIVAHIIPNLKNNVGQTAKTITFATAVYNALNAGGYLAQFTAKNWNVAYA